jgi:hypothetical protein
LTTIKDLSLWDMQLNAIDAHYKTRALH